MANSWRVCALSDLVEIKHGFAFEGEYFREEPPGDILLTPGNFRIGGGFKSDKFKYYAGPVPQEFVLKAGDLLVTMTDLSREGDTLGYPVLVPWNDHRRFLHNQRLGKVTMKEGAELDVRFLYYVLCSRNYRGEILAGATGSTVRHTSPERILAFKFKAPLLAEQREIAGVLSALDEKIELNRRMNETLESIARAIFKSWFVDFDPVKAKAEGRVPEGMDSETAALFPNEFEDSALGPIPTGWTVINVGDAFELTMGQSPPGHTYNENGDGVPFFQGRADFGFRFPTARVHCVAPTRFAEKDDTLVSVRAPVGDVNMALERCCIGRGVAALRHKSNSRSYTYYAMELLRLSLSNFEAEGTVFGSINKNGFCAMKLIEPPADVARAFAAEVLHIDSLIEVNTRQIGALTSFRDTLLPRLISGKLRIPAKPDQ